MAPNKKEEIIHAIFYLIILMRFILVTIDLMKLDLRAHLIALLLLFYIYDRPFIFMIICHSTLKT